jgi:hypothetical protein
MLMNYLEIPRDTPTRIHATDHYYVDRMIWDKDLGKEKPVRSLVLWVDEVNGSPDARTFSIISRTLYDQITPYLPDNDIRNYDFILKRTGEGYRTDWTLEAIPRPPEKI